MPKTTKPNIFIKPGTEAATHGRITLNLITLTMLLTTKPKNFLNTGTESATRGRITINMIGLMMPTVVNYLKIIIAHGTQAEATTMTTPAMNTLIPI